MWQDDPLFVSNPRRDCEACGNVKKHRKRCNVCHGAGHPRIDLAGAWRDTAGFLVCSGPSLSTYPLEQLRDRGVVSLGVNNAAAYAPVRAATFGDPQWKFHHAIHLDPAVMTFAPHDKLRRNVRVKLADGSFRFLNHKLRDCPSMYGLPRSGRFNAATFLTDWFAHWGHGGKGDAAQQPFRRLASMLLGLRLMHYLGCRRVYLLGVDFWWDDKSRGYAWGPASGGRGDFAKINRMLEELRAVFEPAGLEVFNCNPTSRCEAFEHRGWDTAISEARGGISQRPDLADWYSHRRMAADLEAFPSLAEVRRPWDSPAAGLGLEGV